MDIKKRCILLVLISLLFLNVADAKTEIVNVDIDYSKFELTPDGTYFYTFMSFEEIKLSNQLKNSGKYFEIPTNEGYYQMESQGTNPSIYHLFLNNDSTVRFRLPDSSMTYGTWSWKGSNKEITTHIFIKIYDDNTGFMELTSKERASFAVKKIGSNNFELTFPDEKPLNLYLFNDHNAKLGDVNGKWSGTLNAPTPSPTINTPTSTPTESDEKQLDSDADVEKGIPGLGTEFAIFGLLVVYLFERQRLKI